MVLEATVNIIVPLAILDAIGIFLNIWLLHIIKVRTPIFNAIDVVQVIKIVMVMSALGFTVWFEFLPCTQQTSLMSTKICIEAQEFTDDAFFHSICWTLVTVALVRKKVCECRGRASVLVTRRYGLKTLMLCLTPGCLFMAVSGSLLFKTDSPNSNTASSSGNTSLGTAMWSHVNALSTRSSVVFTICHATALILLPLTVLCALYLKIAGIVRQTAQAANELVPIRNRDPFKNIIRSLVIHLTLSCSLWTAYFSIRITSVVLDIDRSYLVFMKVVILIAHPFGEGLMQPSFKKPADPIHQRIQTRSNRQILPNSNTSFSDFRTINHYIDERSTVAGDWKMSRPSERKISNQSYGVANFKEKLAETSPIRNITKGRKESREELRKALKDLRQDPAEYARIRRLSTTLRFSTTAFPDQDMYDSYNMIKHSPVLSSYRRNMVNNNVCEGYISPETIVKDFDSDTSSPNLPQRRWKRLVTTARTVRRFSRTRQKSNSQLESCAEESEGLPDDTEAIHPNASDLNKPRHGSAPDNTGDNESIYTNVLDKTSPWYSNKSKSFDQHKGIKTPSRAGTTFSPPRPAPHKGTRRSNSNSSARSRAMSCVNNDWLQQQHDKRKHTKHKESLEETVFIEADVSPRSSADLLRSVSYDAKIRFNFAGGASVPENKQRHSRPSRYSRHSGEENKNHVVDENATRKESIKMLKDMSEYF